MSTLSIVLISSERTGGYFAVSWNVFWVQPQPILGMVNAMDKAVGKVVNELKTLGVYENTIIIFSSDVRKICFAIFGDQIPLQQSKFCPIYLAHSLERWRFDVGRQ